MKLVVRFMDNWLCNYATANRSMWWVPSMPPPYEASQVIILATGGRL